jgi:CRISPR system Cascade subunit CasC
MQTTEEKTMSENIKIELHLIQNFAPSCLNRDDANMPKDCEFGGVRRARISSQCIKKAARDYFRETGSAEVGVRTSLLKAELIRRLRDKPANQAPPVADFFVRTFYSKPHNTKPDQTAVLLFVPEAEIQEALACLEEYWGNMVEVAATDPKPDDNLAKQKASKVVKLDKTIADEIVERLNKARLSADIALFGRMLAEHADNNTDAAVQVAHAISTHRVDMDFDFFTAMDDLQPQAEPGAGMMGETGFNSACFYRYALIDRDQLIKNLQDDKISADKVIQAFIEAFVRAIPTGKQNSFAAHNPPDFGMIIVRKNGFPCSLANAFTQPIHLRSGHDEDLTGLSIEALCNFHPQIKSVYEDGGVVSETLWHIGHDRRLGPLQRQDAGSFSAAIQTTMLAIASAGEG